LVQAQSPMTESFSRLPRNSVFSRRRKTRRLTLFFPRWFNI